MLAHLHGQLFNASQIGGSLGGLAHTTVARYLDIMMDTMMVRRLEPYFVNIGKRLVKAPKVYLRDSGIVRGRLARSDLARQMSVGWSLRMSQAHVRPPLQSRP